MRSTIINDRNVCSKQLTIEANVIVTATILGFIGTRWEKGQPCSFDIEHPAPSEYIYYHDDPGERVMEPEKAEKFQKEHQEFLHVLSGMSATLDITDRRLGDSLRDGQSPEGGPGALITGAKGSEDLPAHARHLPLTSKSVQEIQRLIAEKNSSLYGFYEGRGAYTGVVDDPVQDRLYVQPTKRVIDPNPDRWHPGADQEHWGLIEAKDKNGDTINLKTDPREGMGPLPSEVSLEDKRIGYIHGMCSAIQKCCEWGPQCTPFEVATGVQTTKMASCFPCTTYMYAGRFPPSSMHLGRGESWVPPANHYINGEDKPMPTYDETTVDMVRKQWNADIFAYLTLGT